MSSNSQIIKETALRTWIAVLVIVGSGLGLLFFYSVREVLLELVIAIILAIALSPIVRFLMRRKLNRTAASILTVFVTLVVLLGIVAAIASPLISQGNDLIHNTPKVVDQITSNSFVKDIDKQYHIIDTVKDYATQIPKLIEEHSAPILSVVSSAVSGITTTAIILILTLFLLMEGPATWKSFTRILGPKNSVLVNRISFKIQKAVGGFVTGNLLISLIAGVVALVALLILRVPYPLALAALVAIFDLIPLVGATLATVVLALVALTKGIWVAVIIIIIMITYQEVEGHIIQPIVYGKALKLSQLLIIISTIIGALIGGIIGVLIAIPVAASVVIIISEILRVNGVDVDRDEVADKKS